jgi:hypothetical protein
LWDVIGFFQAPFINAIAEYLGEGYDGLRFVAVQKRRRSRFAKADFDGMLTYCLLECRMLVDLMEKLREHLATANLPVSRWDGAGAVAASLLRREGIKNHMSVSALVPREISDAAQYAYAGGRIEALRFGHAPCTSIHAYDVRSAYPAAMQYAPCLRHGHWQPYRAYSEDTLGGPCFGLFHVRWKLRATTRLAPFFWRDTDHAIFFPIEGEGWYHAPECKRRSTHWTQSSFTVRLTFSTPMCGGNRAITNRSHLFRRCMHNARNGSETESARRWR